MQKLISDINKSIGGPIHVRFRNALFYRWGGGNKGYFKDTTAREQINTANDKIDALTSGKVPYIAYGSITASSVNEALGKVWDSLTVYERPVIVSFGWYGALMAMMYKYADSQYGMAIAMRYATTDIYTMHVSGGTKAYATK